MADETISPTVWEIYRLTCTVSGKAYIGLTRRGVARRWRGHQSDSRNPKRFSGLIQRAIRKHGAENFVLDVLCEAVALKEAAAIERALIGSYRTLSPYGYNVSLGAGTGHGPIAAAKASAALKGRPKSPEHRAKIAAAKIGKKLSPEHVAHMSESMRGKKLSAETRAKMSAVRKGRLISPEHHAKLAAHIVQVRQDPPIGASGVRGVRKEPGCDRWRATYRRRYLGIFRTCEAAEMAWLAAKQAHLTPAEAAAGSALVAAKSN